jgi:hypothetical protein
LARNNSEVCRIFAPQNYYAHIGMTADQNQIIDSSSLKLHGKTQAANMVKSIIYRWFQLYEGSFNQDRIGCQMDIMDDTVKIMSALGLVSGKIHFSTELNKLNNTENSFQLGEINVYPCGVNMYTAQSEVIYQGKNTAGETHSLVLNFEADLKKIDEFSYKFVRIKLKTDREITGDLTETYPTNRSLSLIHHCMGLIEHQLKDPSKLTSCFLPEFKVYPLEHEPLTNQNQLINWISNINERIHDITVTPTNIQIKRSPSDAIMYNIQFDVLFEGKNAEGKVRNSLSKNIWVVKDNPNDCLPKIQTIHVEKLEPIFI